MTITPPTILASRRFQGGAPASVHGNLSWNDDGQVLYIYTRGVKVLTPYLVSSLPPPKAERYDEDDDAAPPAAPPAGPSSAAGASGSGQAGEGSQTGKTRRARGGDLGWYVNNVQQKDVDREGRYRWADVGDETTQVVSMDEAEAKAAVWSPSGIADSGGCMLVIMSTRGQASIYAPTKDPSSTRWEEIFDLTLATRHLSEQSSESALSVQTVLEMRATAVAWSRQTPLRGAVGRDSSVLAVGSRGGHLSLWEYGPQRRFRRTHVQVISRHWPTKLAWSPWSASETDEHSASAVLTVALADGTVLNISVRRTCTVDALGRTSVSLDVAEPEVVPDADKRTVTMLQWINDVLIIARSGSITLVAPPVSPPGPRTWSGVRRVVLPQLGNWAGANPYGDCAGIAKTSAGDLLVVLSGHLYYLITDLSTSPSVAASSTALTLSLYSRRMFMESNDLPFMPYPPPPLPETASKDEQKAHAQEVKKFSSARLLTGRTAGWEALGEAGLASWYGEMFCNHDLSSTTEAKKSHHMYVADLGGLIPSRAAIGDDLELLLDDPPSLFAISPLKVLMPFMLRILAALDPSGVAVEVADVLAAGQEQDPGRRHQLERAGSGKELRSLIWADSGVDAARLRYSLARFCDARLGQASATSSESADQTDAATPQFGTIAASSLEVVRQGIDEKLAAWMSTLDLSGIRGDDLRFATHVAKACPTTHLNNMLDQARAKEADAGGASTDRCPACGTAIEDDGSEIGNCAKGHEWNRCTVTGYLLLNASYRTCSMCGAASLLPTCHKDPARPVLPNSGRERDYKRFERSTYHLKGAGSESGTALGAGSGAEKQEGWLLDEALEAAVSCVLCGGRWVRAM